FFTRLFYHLLSFITSEYKNTLRKALQTTSALSATSKLCFEQPILFLPSNKTDFESETVLTFSVTND
ncbi:hypothetical protein, partial [Streptococcus pneumoniae]|uniref:hypothetical protein n=1 Tax=Streptococcus pneumoniae TaxID=1313 RepID=UPI001C5E02B9